MPGGGGPREGKAGGRSAAIFVFFINKHGIGVIHAGGFRGRGPNDFENLSADARAPLGIPRKLKRGGAHKDGDDAAIRGS